MLEMYRRVFGNPQHPRHPKLYELQQDFLSLGVRRTYPTQFSSNTSSIPLGLSSIKRKDNCCINSDSFILLLLLQIQRQTRIHICSERKSHVSFFVFYKKQWDTGKEQGMEAIETASHHLCNCIAILRQYQ